MFNLILIELKKIFHKKSIYIVWVLLFGFCVANNILYKVNYDDEGYYISDYIKDNSKGINELESELSKYNKDKIEDVFMYVKIKTELDLLKLKNNYNIKSWQYNKVDYLEDDVYNINYYSYIDDDKDKYNEYVKSYNDRIDRFNNDDWKYFVYLERDDIKNNIRKLEDELKDITDKLDRENNEKLIKEYKDKLNILNIRINNDIDYGINYLNDALISYEDELNKFEEYDDISNLNYSDKVKYNEIVSNVKINKYIIDNKINLNKENNLNCLLRTIVEDYQLFIVIVIILVSGSIVSEEFNKGTIKLLLIKPFSRGKILLGKYLASIIALVITIIFAILIELIIGGYLFGFDSLSIKVISYNFDTNMIVSYNIFKYMIIRIIYDMPILLMILTISFSISTIFCNTIMSISLSMFLYVFSSIINSFINKGNAYILKYLLTINWDFKNYMFGGLSKVEYINFKFSLYVYIGYLIIILFSTFMIFERNSIKNI